MPCDPQTLRERRASAKRALHEIFKHPDYRPFQGAVIDALLAERDVFAVAATGGGKSLCYGLPALVLPGLTVVISPLIALMRDQVQKLQALGIDAVRLSGDVPERRQQRDLERLAEVEIVFVSPEKAKTAAFREALQGVRVAMFALDEAHLASRAADWRSSYASLGDLLRAHDEAVRFACTATADEHAEADVRRIFDLRDPVRLVGSPWRENIRWQFEHGADESDLFQLIRDYQDRPGSQIVYVSSRNMTEKLAHMLASGGLSAAYYHAGMIPELRATTQDRFLGGDVTCMVATTAFGMGVDKSDIRLVANFQIPASLFDLLQQTGRASRDGEDALGWVNLGGKSEQAQRFFIETSNPSIHVYNRLWKAFTKHDKALKWPRDVLMRIAGVTDPIWQRRVESAVSYLEYTGHIDTAPGGELYRMEIKNRLKAARLCHVIQGAHIEKDSVVYTPTAEKDDARIFVAQGACHYASPQDTLIIRTLLPKLTLTEDDIEAKKDRALDQLDLIAQFAEAENKRGFVEACFAKSGLTT